MYSYSTFCCKSPVRLDWFRYRNPDVEAKRKMREEERLRTALNNAKSRQLRVEQNYDIVTHSTFLSAKEASLAHDTWYQACLFHFENTSIRWSWKLGLGY